VLIISAALVYLPMDEQNTQSQEVVVEGLVPAPHAPQGWYVFSEELLNKTLEEGRPVFLDIGAEWCKNCKTNEKTVLFTDAVMQEFAAKNVLLLRGDFTRKDAKLLAWIKKHERAGVPFNALYIPGQEPILFNELISKGEVSNALNRIPE
jgi:thiol:disulfide interchange protein